jgi:hypothetical protein
MSKYHPMGIDWRCLDGARASGISYLIGAKSGDITDPGALRTFYTRLYYAKTTKTQTGGKTAKGG